MLESMIGVDDIRPLLVVVSGMRGLEELAWLDGIPVPSGKVPLWKGPKPALILDEAESDCERA